MFQIQQYVYSISFHDLEEDEHDVSGWDRFQDVFMISALTGDGIQLLQVLCNIKNIAVQWYSY